MSTPIALPRTSDQGLRNPLSIPSTIFGRSNFRCSWFSTMCRRCIRLNSSEIANAPISAGTVGMPSSNQTISIVPRTSPRELSPIVPNKRPNVPARKPRAKLPPCRPAISVSPQMATMSISVGPSFKTKRPIGSIVKASTKYPKSVPTTDAISPNPRASLWRPCWVIGKPSKAVAVAAGWPGMLNNIAGMALPKAPPV